jgi:hypothetical protein
MLKRARNRPGLAVIDVAIAIGVLAVLLATVPAGVGAIENGRVNTAERSVGTLRATAINWLSNGRSNIAAVAGVGASVSLAPAPAMATEPGPVEHGAPAPVIRRIQATPPVANARSDAPAPLPGADKAQASGAPLDPQTRELVNLRSQAAALRRALDLFLASVERAMPRVEPAAQRSEPVSSPPTPARSLKAVPQPAPAEIRPSSPSPSKATPSR